MSEKSRNEKGSSSSRKGGATSDELALSIATAESFDSKIMRARYQAAARSGGGCYGSLFDIFFHLVMYDATCAASFMKTFFPEWAKRLDFDGATVLPCEIYHGSFKKWIVDFALSVPLRKKRKKKGEKEETAVCHIVLEHKAQSGDSMNRRTVKQAVLYLVWESFESGANAGSQAISGVVYTGSDTTIEEFEWGDYFRPPKFLDRFRLRFRLRAKIPCLNITRLVHNGALKDLDMEPIIRFAWRFSAAPETERFLTD